MKKKCIISVLFAVLGVFLVLGYITIGCNTSQAKKGDDIVILSESDVKRKAVEEQIEKDYGKFQLFDSCDLTYDFLYNRVDYDYTVVETITAIVKDDYSGTYGEEGDYISYKNVECVKPGDKVLTYCIYDPMTRYEDDIKERIDIVIE